MSYTPTVWKKGDKITSEKLNKLENGVAGSGGGVLVVHANESGALDKTWQEMADAVEAGIVCTFHFGEIVSDNGLTVWYLTGIFAGDGEYGVAVSNSGDTVTFIADSASGYPVVENGG